MEICTMLHSTLSGLEWLMLAANRMGKPYPMFPHADLMKGLQGWDQPLLNRLES
jgi:hypothetical protein